MNNKITDALQSFGSSAMCRWMKSEAAVNAVPWVVAAGLRQPTPQGKVAALGLFALQQGCALNNTDEPFPPGNGCVETEKPTVIEFKGSIGWESPLSARDSSVDYLNIVSLDDSNFNTPNPSLEGKYLAQVTTTFADGSSSTWLSNQSFDKGGAPLRLKTDADNPCKKESDDTPVDPTEPITDYSPELNCELTATLGGYLVNPSGNVSPIIKYSAGDPQTREGGEIISGCNWYGDVVQVSNDGGCGCPPTGPLPPDIPWPIEGDGVPDWLQDLITDIGANLLTNELAKLFETPLSPANYQLLAPCEFDSEGNRLKVEVEIPALPPLDALATRIEALIPILQGQKDFKQPICPGVKAQGDLRTIGFISEEISPNGKSRLRKRLRYRSQSGIGLDGLIDHWASFSFDAGPVIVKHIDGSWGTVTCWASSTTEGKRVIRHAAAEAAIDVDKTGRWEVSSSTSTRRGMPGTMKVNQTGGYYWITARDGSDNRPMVGKT